MTGNTRFDPFKPFDVIVSRRLEARGDISTGSKRR
jgi:hypothetical protein